MWHLVAQSAPSSFSTTIDQLARTPLSRVLIFVAVCTALRIILYAAVKPDALGFGASAARFFNEMLDALVYAGVFVFLIIRPFGVQAFTIPSESMVETLLVNDYIAANKAIYRYSEPKVGDIVVFRPPKEAAHHDQLGEDGEPIVDFIKRLIGGPGDLIEIKDGKLFRNGQEAKEPFVSSRMDFDFKIVQYKGEYWPVAIAGHLVNSPYTTVSRYQAENQEVADELERLPAVAIPPGKFLFMGDNRANSSDGRSWGLVGRDAIVGRSEVIWLPFSRWRSTR